VKNGTLTCNGTASVTFNIPEDKWGSYLFVVNDKQGGHTFAKVISFDWAMAIRRRLRVHRPNFR